MLSDIAINAFSVLLFSYAIASRSRIADPQVDADKFLFGGNSKWLAASSNVGSLLSITILFNLYYNGLYGYGLVGIPCMATGMILGYFLLILALRRTHRNYASNGRPLHNSTLLGVVTDGEKSAPLMLVFLSQYLLALISEFGVLISFLRDIFPVGSSAPLAIAMLIAFLCATYTAAGGYSGILRTDLFQLCVFLVGLSYLSWKLWEPLTGLIEDVLILENCPTPPFGPPATYVLFTIAGFGAFPDTWVRNFTTIRTSKDESFKHLSVSVIGLLFVLVPLTVLGLLVFKQTDKLDFRFDCLRTHDAFVGQFLSAPVISQDPLLRWFIVACLLCAFITTIDTWLIGIAQHARRFRRGISVEILNISPFFAVFVSVAVAAMLSNRGVFVTGLLIFPFLFFNWVFLAAGVFPNVKAFQNRFILLTAIGAGVLMTVAQVILKWDHLEVFPHSSIFYSCLTVYGVVGVGMLHQTFWARP